ncbi:hypothetical protein IAD21_04406 [Abditibacteriota bacterium]|nr:hypothetical protein IAD21_04406 [Abditibacteriota bacterium]
MTRSVHKLTTALHQPPSAPPSMLRPHLLPCLLSPRSVTASAITLMLMIAACPPATAGEWKVREYLRQESHTAQTWVLASQTETDANGQSHWHLKAGKNSFLTNAHSYPSYQGPPYQMGYHLYTSLTPLGGFSRRVDDVAPYHNTEGNYSPYNHGTDTSIGFQSPGYNQIFGEPELTIEDATQTGGTVVGEMSITPLLEWVPTHIDRHDGQEPRDDPTDLPPALSYFWEGASIHGFEYFFAGGYNPVPYDEDNPYHNVDFTFSGLKCPFTLTETNTDPAVNTDALLGVDYSYSGYGGSGTRSTVAGTNIYALKNPGRSFVLQGPTRYFAGNITLSSAFFSEEYVGQSGSARVEFDYQFKPVTPSIVWDAAQSSVAAGAKANAVHQAKFHLQFKDQGQTALPSDAMPPVKVEVLDGGLGLDESVRATVKVDPLLDANGEVTGTFTSGNRVQTTTIGLLQLPGDKTSGTLASTGINQGWANVEWKLGDDDETSWEHLRSWGEPFFFDDDADYTRVAYAKLTSPADKPLTPHSFKFLIHKLVVEVTDANGDTATHFITNDPAEAQQHLDAIAEHLEDASTQVIYEPDLQALTASVASYITPPAPAVSDAEGIVKGAFTVKHGPNFVVDTFGFTIQDQDVLTR